MVTYKKIKIDILLSLKNKKARQSKTGPFTGNPKQAITFQAHFLCVWYRDTLDTSQRNIHLAFS